MIAANGRKIVHSVEGGDFVSAHEGHAQICGDIFDYWNRQPALSLGIFPNLALGKVEQRHHRRLLATSRVARDITVGFFLVRRRKREAAPFGADFGFVWNVDNVSHYRTNSTRDTLSPSKL